MLAFAAGAVNAGAFLANQRFVSHVTGIVSRIGLDVGQWPLLLDYAIVLVCFVAGAAASVLAIDGRRHRGKHALWSLPLVLVSMILTGVAVAGSLGAFGTFGGTVEQPVDFFVLSVLAFAMGMQNAAVATTTGLAVRTTHMTGPATDLGVHLATAWFARGDARKNSLRGAMLRAAKILSFAAGAAVMVPFTRAGGYVAFVLPASAIVVATAISFIEPVTATRPVGDQQ